MDLTLLKAINYALPYMGEAQVTSTDVRNPTVALVLSAIETHQMALLAEGMWFNTAKRYLYPDNETQIFIPTNTLSIYSLENRTLEERNGRLYDVDNGTFSFDSKVYVDIKEWLKFEELPIYARYVLMVQAAIQVYVQDYGPENTIQVLYKELTKYQNLLRQEHLRKQDYNTMRSNRGARFIKHLRR